MWKVVYYCVVLLLLLKFIPLVPGLILATIKYVIVNIPDILKTILSTPIG